MRDERPVVLLHGLGMSERVWDRVRPWLEPEHEVIAPTAAGHRGGAAAGSRPVRVRDLVDEAERALDERGLDRVHVAGSSLGGWIAIELARRGRAASVCAISPAGFWRPGTEEQRRGVRKIRRAARLTRLGDTVSLPLLMRSPVVRRLALRDVATRGDRLTPAEATQAGLDLLGCPVLEDLLTTDEEITPLDPLPCPVTLAWAAEDAVVPAAVNGRIARERLPAASFVTLAGTGHVPMIDDPRAVAVAILRSARQAAGAAAGALVAPTGS